MIRRTSDGPAHHAPRPRFVPGRLTIKWKEDVDALAPGGRRALAAHLQDPLSYLRKNCGLRSVVPVFPGRRRVLTAGPRRERDAVAVVASLAPVKNRPRGLMSLRVAADTDLVEACRRISGGAIEYAEPVPARWLAAQDGASDPRRGKQWGLGAIKWPGAARPDASKIHVAVLDSGVDEGHPDLAAAIEAYEHGDFRPADLIGHGTHVAGIIAAVMGNRVGTTGVAGCRLHCWKVFGDEPEADGEIYLDDVAYTRALAAVLDDDRIRVVNMSLGGVEASRSEKEYVGKLVKKGVLVVAAMGNEREEGNPKEYPAALPGVLAVGAVDADLRLASFSNTGGHIGLVAPGVDIESTLPRRKSAVRKETGYASWDGTSMATPFVVGAAALLCARHPDLQGRKLADRLKLGTRWNPETMGRTPSTKPRKSARFGAGVLDLAALLSR